MRTREKIDGGHQRKKILVPYFWNYYLFDYLKFLVPQLSEDGFDVTVLTCQKKVEDIFRDHGTKIVWVPIILRYFMARSGRMPHRVCLWIRAWCWGLTLRRKYDFAVLPWDNKPAWYVLSCVIPSLTCHNTKVNVLDKS